MEGLPEFFVCEPLGIKTKDDEFFVLHTVHPKWLAFVNFEDRPEGYGAKFRVVQVYDGADPGELSDSIARALQELGNDPRNRAKKI